MAGINFNAMIGEMFQARYQTQIQPVIEKEQVAAARISGIGKVQSAFSSLYNVLDDLEDDLSTLSATPSEDAPFTASVTSATAAIASEYDVAVTQVAEKHKLVSSAVDENNIGTGNITFTVNGTDYETEITSDEDTLVEVAAAINASSWNQGSDRKIVASVLSTTAGMQLVYTAATAGTDSQISAIALSGTLNTNIDDTSVVQAAQNAALTIDGQAVTSQTNDVTGVIPGVKITLKSDTFDGASPPASVSGELSVSADPDAASNTLNDFIKKFNAVLDTIDSKSVKGNLGEEGGKGPLASNGVVSGLDRALVRAAGASVTIEGNTYDFSDIGITVGYDGKMTLNKTTLENFIDTGSVSIQDILFDDANSLITSQMTGILQGYEGVNGFLEDEEGRLTDRQTQLRERRERLDDRINKDLDKMLAEIDRINALQSSLQQSVGLI